MRTSSDAALDKLQDWVVSTPCCCHDAQKALQWSLFGITEESDITKHLYLVVEAVRNGYDILMAQLPAFVASNVAFVDGANDPDEVYQFWIGLDLAPDYVEALVDLDLCWTDDRLCVSSRHRHRPDLAECIISLLVDVLRVRKFTDSR